MKAYTQEHSMQLEKKSFYIYWPKSNFRPQEWLPAKGNVVFTLLVIGSLLWAQNAGAISLGVPVAATISTAGIPYQGRLADKNGAPLTQTVNMIFRLYAAANGGSPLWEEQWTGANSVQVSDGLFNVMLGSLTPIPQAVITGNSNLFLGITVGTDSEMNPRVQLGSVPFATQALTVPDGSVTTAKLADGSVTRAKLASGIAGEQVFTLKLPDGWTTSTSTAIANFGSINLPVKSNLFIMGMWVVANNTSAFGINAKLLMDGTPLPIYGDVIPFSSQGIGYTIARNHFIADVPAGTHTFAVEIGQFPFRTNDIIAIGTGSVMWIRAVPVE
jgi:hypothetical protein